MFPKILKYDSVPQNDDETIQLNALSYRGFPLRSVCELFADYATVVLAVLCVVNSIIGVLIIAHLYMDPNSIRDVHKLETRSPYIGFDSIYNNQRFVTTKYPPIQNQPRVLAPVYANEPNKVNTSTLSYDERSFTIPLTIDFALRNISAKLSFVSLLDSGSTNCFIDSRFVYKHALPTSSISPINLRLFDGSLSPKPISKTTSLNIPLARQF
ncbi:hypothetical protein J3R30DRAFT_3699409 [Lentinula aciculospora]|uniref:Uncharacterized protein n=1 Tax=Lentinula aciculospora TaxID=153920 RepID=A0A9W9AHP8_9AGAR|nr:hypothetical protein J3R30DRAFT_3699409 [Lentinula aciculospora]